MTAESELLRIFSALIAGRQDTAWQGSLAGFGLERLPLEIEALDRHGSRCD